MKERWSPGSRAPLFFSENLWYNIPTITLREEDLHAEADPGPGRGGQDHRRAGPAVPGGGGAPPGAHGARAAVPRGRAGPVPGGGTLRQPVRRGALLQPSGQPGLSGGGGPGGGGAGRRRPAAAHVPGGAQCGGPAEGVRPPLPPARLPSVPPGHGGRAEKRLHPPGDPGGGGGGRPRARGGQAPGPGAPLRGVPGPHRPQRPGPPGPAHPGGGQAETLPLGQGQGPVAGRLHRLHGPAGAGAGAAHGPGGPPDGHPHL